MAQLLRLFFVNVLHVPVLPGLDVVGILYFLLNLPLLIVSYKVVGKEFCITSVVSITLCSVALGIMPIPEEPIFNDYLTACLIGGVVAGIGAGMVLRVGSSQGGQDIIGVIVSVLNPNHSVGKISIMINIGVYIICLFLFNVEIVAYSLIYTTVLATSSVKAGSSMKAAPPVDAVSSGEAADGVRGLFTTPMVHIRTPSHHSLGDICG